MLCLPEVDSWWSAGSRGPPCLATVPLYAPIFLSSCQCSFPSVSWAISLSTLLTEGYATLPNMTNRPLLLPGTVLDLFNFYRNPRRKREWRPEGQREEHKPRGGHYTQHPSKQRPFLDCVKYLLNHGPTLASLCLPFEGATVVSGPPKENREGTKDKGEKAGTETRKPINPPPPSFVFLLLSFHLRFRRTRNIAML